MCAIKECCVTIENYFCICSFEVNSFNAGERIIDLTLVDEMTYEDINIKLENNDKIYRFLYYK